MKIENFGNDHLWWANLDVALMRDDGTMERCCSVEQLFQAFKDRLRYELKEEASQ